MSKKKKRWFERGWSTEELNQSLFPNSIKQHSEKLKKQRAIDEYDYNFDDDQDYSSHSWDWDRKLLGKEQNLTGDAKKDRENKYELNRSEYSNYYSNYEKTGYWGGYYRQPQLTYKYVQQMANALSVQHNIKVEIGNEWKADLIAKRLTYNPASLIYGTKSELLATLMHEIGKLRYVTHSSLLKNKYLTMYRQPAMEVLSIYEDLRTDYLMLKAYESASEIYESIIPLIEKQVKDYMSAGEGFRALTAIVPDKVFRNIMANYSVIDSNGQPVQIQNNIQLKSELIKVFGTSDIESIEINLAVLKTQSKAKGSIYEYCGEMLCLMYDLDDQGHKKFDNIKDKVEKTTDTIEASKKTANSQALVDYLDTTTYPVVEDLLKNAHDNNEMIKEAFPQISAEGMKILMDEIKNEMRSQGKQQGVNVDENGNMKTRNSGPSSSTIPPEWQSGDYKTLKDSVSMEIRQLINRLTFIRREELTVRYEANQKRGRLNARKLYKSIIGSRRLFKQKLDNTDTIQSFAFSVLLDTSGSMDGARITHCTRALIILAEVFKKMGIPFELVTFSDGATVIKPFGSEIDKAMERSIGGLVRASGGSTNLHEGLEKLQIHKQSEKNKIVIVLTDGGVGSPDYYDKHYFIPWAKKGIKSVGFGIECESQMAQLCQGNSKLLTNASQLPVEFSKLLKSLIKR